MLNEIAAGVWVHSSEFVLSNTVVVRGNQGALLIDPGITATELECIADDLSGLGLTVVGGFSTHPDWDHVLWHDRFGVVPRYATAACAEHIRSEMDDPTFLERVADHVPEEIHGQVPLELFGLIDALPAGASEYPWDGPRVRIIEHRAHAPGHAALLIEDSRVLVAGDMLSDVFPPMLDLESDVDPIDEYLTALVMLRRELSNADFVVPGHGTVGGADELRARIEGDRTYLLTLRDGGEFTDSRVGPNAQPGWEWVSGIHEWQVQSIGERG